MAIYMQIGGAGAPNAGGGFRLNITAFVISFAIGILYVYLIRPPPTKVIHQFPTPFNTATVYKDAAGNCFVFDAIRVDPCPKETVAQKPTV